MKPIILGTAGHIDHGKTTLIKALTGVNTDRLKEEQLRGITIELGFADLTLPSGQRLGIVDVPGHEKFVKNMVAGATGIDMVAMIIAADEGVMPQTREHMEICSLLDIKHGLVALTKIDLVDEEWLELVRDDIEQFVRGSFLEGAPIIPVSAATGEGLDRFQEALDKLSAQVPERSSAGLFRLPVDRVFTMRGFGTVITGTLASGKVKLGETVQIYPANTTSKVRGLQVHGRSVEEAAAGMRTAINLQGIDKAKVQRGQVVALPATLIPTYMVDVELVYLASNTKAIKNRTRIRFHSGTSEVLGNLILLEAEELGPGERALAQIRLEKPVVLVRDDRFVIRSYSPVRAIGGGRILNPVASKHKRFKAEVIDHLRRLAGDADSDLVATHIESSGWAGCSLAQLRVMTNQSPKALERVLSGLLSKKTILMLDKEARRYVHSITVSKLETMLKGHLDEYHRLHRLRAGMPKEELKSKLPDAIDQRLFTLVLNKMVKAGAIIQEDELVRLDSHKVTLAADQKKLRAAIVSLYLESGLMPPYFKEVCRKLQLQQQQARQVLELLLSEGVLVKVKNDLYFHHQPLEKLQQNLVQFLVEHQEIDTGQFKDMTGASRKFVIPLLEYFDSCQVTIRVGDIRRLRKKAGQ